MFNINKFNALCSEKGIKKKELAERTKIPLERLYRKQKTGSFTRAEILALCSVLGKDETLSVFFDN